MKDNDSHCRRGPPQYAIRPVGVSAACLLSLVFSFGCSGARLASARKFSAVFRPQRGVTIAMPTEAIYCLAADVHGEIYACDPGCGCIRRFDPAGRPLPPVGQKGREPGQLALPYAVSIGTDGRIYVLDEENGAVVIFDSSGKYQESVPFSQYGFAGLTLAVDPDRRALLVGGLMRPFTPGAPMLHVFLSGGGGWQHEADFYDQDDQVATLNLKVVGGVAAAVGPKGEMFIAQPDSPRIARYDWTGKHLGDLVVIPGFYVPPKAIPARMPFDPAGISKLLSSWTELSDLRWLGSDKLLVTFETHTPMHYGYEMLTENGSVIFDDIEGEYQPAFGTPDGKALYFWKPYLRGSSTTALTEFAFSDALR